MRASPPLPLLLLLSLLLYCVSAAQWDQNKWKECGDTAICKVDMSCVNPKQKLSFFVDFITVDADKRKCDNGIHIKPDSVTKWTVSILNNQLSSNGLTWMLAPNKEIFKCKNNKAESGGEIEFTVKSISSSNVHCEFTVEAQSKISDLLEQLNKEHKSYLQSDNGKQYLGISTYKSVDERLNCPKEQLFNKEPCPADEDCDEPYIDFNCNQGYTTLLRVNKESDFKEATISCYEGQFYWSFNEEWTKITEEDKDKQKVVPDEAAAKCSRKKCSLCTRKEGFGANITTSDDDPCVRLTCNPGWFMVINTTSSKALTSSEDVKCSAKTSVAKHIIQDYPPALARWVVGKDDDVDIETAVCVESLSCERGSTKMTTKCDETEKTDHSCAKAQRKPSGDYECEKGYTMQLMQNNKPVPIDPPVCEPNGSWSMRSANTSISVADAKELIIKCYLNAVPKTAPSPPSQSRVMWIVVLVTAVICVIIAIVIGIFCYLKHRNPKRGGVSTANKTSTSTSKSKNSSKPSSSELEPLTSAMVSVTADSMQTAKPTPVVLAKADLRPSTAAVTSDPSTKKEEKKDKEKKKEQKKERKKEEGEERVEKTCEQDKSDRKASKRENKKEKVVLSSNRYDETSKKQDSRDVTSTKERFAPMRSASEGEDPLKSQTGGEGESQVEKEKINGESAKLLPKGPRKYTKSSSNVKPNNEFLNVTDSDEDGEPSQTGSKKRGRKRK